MPTGKKLFLFIGDKKMKTIVLANLKQVFETIMTLCNILQLHVLSHNKNVVVYSDLFNDEKIIILNKEYSEVIYHDYTNAVHVCYEINNSEKLFMEYYNRYENSTDIISKLNEVIEKLEKDNSDLNDEIETMTNESIQEIDYLNNRIETLKNHNIELNKANEQMNNKLAYYESEYQDIVAEKMQQYENKYDKLMTVAKKDRENLKQEITEKDTLINSLYNQISTVQLTKNKEIEKMKQENQEFFESFMREYNSHTETIKANEQLKIDIKSYKQQIEEMKKQNNYLHKKIRKMNK